VSGQLHALLLYPRYPLDRRLGGPQSRYGRRGGEKILDPTGIRTPTHRSSILYAIQAHSLKHVNLRFGVLYSKSMVFNFYDVLLSFFLSFFLSFLSVRLIACSSKKIESDQHFLRLLPSGMLSQL
jgi:hypothetical protein